MIRNLSVVVAILAGFGNSYSSAQGPEQSRLYGDSTQTRKRLAEAEQKLLSGKTADATDDLQRILDEVGDELFTVDGKNYRAARWIVHGLLARMPAESLSNYQDRIEAPARKLLEAAKQSRDLAAHWQLLDRYFVSRPAGEGLAVLGDLLFERGDFRTAEIVWKRLLPDAGADIVHPNPKADPAAVRARLVLAAIFQNDPGQARRELAALESKHPKARGHLAGRDGPYVDTLQSFLDHPPRLPLAANPGNNWLTFAGGPDRSGRVTGLSRFLPRRPTWSKPIASAIAARPLELPEHPPGRPPYGNPVIVNGHVIVSDGYELLVFDAVAGKLGNSVSLLNRPQNMPRTPDATPSLTVAGNRLYARAGPGALKPGDNTAIVCLAMAARSDGTLSLKELWRIKPPVVDGKPAVWEGAPLVVDRRMWIAYSQFDGGRIVQGIACHDPADPGTAPEHPTWSVNICEGPVRVSKSTGVVENRSRHELLTFAGRNLIFNSNAGSIVAVNALTGRRAWAFRYPRARKLESSRSAEPAPAVFAGGRVFVAPADADRVYSLDPETGQVLWVSGPTEGASILGVSAGRLIVAVAGPVRGIRGLNIANGSYREPEGWIQHNGGGLLGYGRGLVTDDVIVWPTRNGPYFLHADDGSPITGIELVGDQFDERHSEPLGNIAYADGVLVIVTPTHVLGYVSETRRFGSPQSRAGRERFEEQIALAEESLARGEIAAAQHRLLEMISSTDSRPARAWAAARLHLLSQEIGSQSRLPDDWKRAIPDELLGEWLFLRQGIPIRLGTLLDPQRDRMPASLPASSIENCRLKRDDAPALSAESDIADSIVFEHGTVPLQWIPGMATPPKRMFFSSSNGIRSITIREKTATRFDCNETLTHAAGFDGGFVAAGPYGVAIYGEDHSPDWIFRVPGTPVLPGRLGEFQLVARSDSAPAELSSFHLIGTWLFARLGERHLIALDLRGRRVVWVLGANGRPGYHQAALPGAARFGQTIATIGRHLVVQLTSGERWVIQAETGTLLDRPNLNARSIRTPSPHPIIAIDADRLIAVDGPGSVRLLDAATGKTLWTQRQDGEASFAGEPLQARAWCDALLVAVRRNHGVELQRLGIDDGEAMWTDGGAFLDSDHLTLANADADDDRVYVPYRDGLTAISLKDGSSEWDVGLPPSHGANGWVVRAGSKCIIVYPEQAVPREAVSAVAERLQRSFASTPEPWRLPALGAVLYDAWVARAVPILLLDPETGKQLGYFELPAAGPAITTWFDRETAVVATGKRAVWLR